MTKNLGEKYNYMSSLLVLFWYYFGHVHSVITGHVTITEEDYSMNITKITQYNWYFLRIILVTFTRVP